MTTPTISPFLKQERSETDDSLITERGKTDESILNLREKTEAETDIRVKSDRLLADESRTNSRAKTDQNTEAEEQLQDQRRVEDKTVEKERARMDAALKRERKLNGTAASTMLGHEREETDDNLSHERDRTDREVQKASTLLNAELTSHSQTKADLTTRDEFLAIVSHDLRNPIGAILSATDFLLDDASVSGLSAELRSCIDLIKRNAQTSLRLIGDILDMERVVEGKLQLQSGSQDLTLLLEEAIESFSALAAAKRITFNVAPCPSPISANCDRDRIAQVLSNLIGNALKFTPENGKISFEISREGTNTLVTVSDNGPGIDEAEQLRIFDQYTQLKNKDRRGLGLGLFISKMLIEAHGGKLWVTSKPGHGSTFSFSLPNPAQP